MYLNECVSLEVIILIHLILVLHPFNARATATEAKCCLIHRLLELFDKATAPWSEKQSMLCSKVIDNKGSRSLLL